MQNSGRCALLAPLALILIACAAGPVYAQATVSTDSDNYPPGSRIHITGSGWLPGETVGLSIYKNSTDVLRAELTSAADGAGEIVNDEFVLDASDANSGFAVQATGSVSGLRAERQFADGNFVTNMVVGGQSPTSVQGGGAATYSITLSGLYISNYFGHPFCGGANAVLSVIGLPSTCSYGFAVNPLASSAGPNCSGSTTLTIYTSASTPAGTYPIQVMADAGTTCWWWNCAPDNQVRTVTLVVTPGDVLPPVPAHDPLPVVSGECSAAIANAPTAVDQVSGMIVGTTADPLIYSSQGTFHVHWTYTDAAGNRSYQVQDVVVHDVTPPLLTVPTTLHVTTGPGATTCGKMIPDSQVGVATATDNCSGEVGVSRSGFPSGNVFPVGTTGFFWSAIDAAGNSALATQYVTVTDDTPPVLTCPADIVVPTDPGATTAHVTYTPTVADNCEGAIVSCDPPSGWGFAVGTTTVNVRGTDAAGNISMASFTVTVQNPPPVASMTGPASGAVYAVGTPVTFVGGFTDNPADLHTAVWALDGAMTPGTVDESSSKVTGSYTFTAAGVYMISLTVTDQCGGSSVTTQVGGLDAMVVVYDPSAGFVTGGGWINSPPGAYAPDPTLFGKANFGFVSKYQRGASVPTGETEFQFKVANLNFHSTSYDWLVIAGTKAQYKGTGTISGVGSYEFMLTATDGNLKGASSPDRFRVKLTNLTTGTLVYDNQSGAPDGSDPTTALGGGSIVIQSNTGGMKLTGASSMPVDSPASFPTSYALFPNRPNPFRGSTTIRFDLPEAGRVSLVVCDVSGRIVRTLASEVRTAGRHEIAWSGGADDGSRVAAGVYFCRMTAQPMNGGASFTSLRRMIVLR